MANPTEQEMLADLAAADAAGDTQLATAIAGRIKAARTSAPSSGRGVESAVRGGLQGLTAGWGDEAAGAIAAALPFTDREAAGPGASFSERYTHARDFYRKRNADAEAAHPGLYTAGQLAGAVAPAAVLGAPVAGGRALALAVGQGAAQGAGASEASTAGALARDTALGAGLGGAGYGVGSVLGRALSAISRKGSEMAGLASARAGAKAADEVAGEIASARGALGGEVQKGSRYVENLMRLEESMTPEQRALYGQLQASGVVPNLQQSVAQSTLERLPGQAGTIADRQAALAALQDGAPEAVAARTQALLKPQPGADAKSFFKSYGEPVVASALGYGAADALGASPEQKATAAGVAGLIFGRTRAGKALWTRLNRPAHQYAIGTALESAPESPLALALRRGLAHGVPATMTPAAIRAEE